MKIARIRGLKKKGFFIVSIVVLSLSVGVSCGGPDTEITDAVTTTLAPGQPVVTIVTPIDGATTEARDVLVTITAEVENSSIQKVELQVNGGDFKAVTGASNYMTNVRMIVGSNELVARAVSDANLSNTAESVIIRTFSRIYVSTNGDNANLGTSDYPLLSIQKAISNASASAKNEIYVRSGVYFVGGGLTPNIAGSLFITNDNIQIYGGWTAGFVTNTGMSTIYIQTNSMRAVYISNAANFILDSFFITGSTNISGNGGAMYITETSNSIIENCIISNNSSTAFGGGLYIKDSLLSLKNNSIVFNKAVDSGGGIYLYHSDVSLLTNSISSNSASQRGGGIFTYQSDSYLDYNTINSNRATLAGGGVHVDANSPEFYNNLITQNYAGSYGGGVYLQQAATAVFESNIVSFNRTSQHGGGYYYEGQSNPAIRDNIINNNYAGGNGGGICSWGGLGVIKRNSINLNTAVNGGGLYLTFNSTNFILQNDILGNIGTAATASVIFINDAGSTPNVISNNIGSTNSDDAHYGIYENAAVAGHNMNFNCFATNGLGFLYYDSVNFGTADIADVNNAVWSGATSASNNTLATLSLTN